MQQESTQLKRRKDGRFTRGQKAHNESDLQNLVRLGQTFGNWQVINSSAKRLGGYRYVEVLCLSCQTKGWKSYDNLKAGKSASCLKCNGKKNTKYHNRFEYLIEKRGHAARQRCQNPKSPEYPNYGGRGIEFRFKDIEHYVNYVKSLPNADPALEIDRIDNMGHYEEGNIRWVTSSENRKNTRRNRMVEHEGNFYVFKDFVKQFTDLGMATALRYIRQGFTPEELRRIVQNRESGRPSLRHLRSEGGELLHGCYDNPIYV